MLTNTGKNILAKYLIGQAPAYASYIALGCGPTPLGSGDSFGDYSAKKSLDFEMFRTPIISRGYVTEYVYNEAGEIDTDPETGEPITYSQIVFTAQLPTEERYEISEIGVFSAGSNPLAAGVDSRILYTFNKSENWEYHVATTATSIPEMSQPLDLLPDNTKPEGAEFGDINIPDKAFFAKSSNTIFDSAARLSRYERPRFLDSSIMLRGDSSNVTGTSVETLDVSESNTAHIHVSDIALAFDKQSGQDELKLAFSVINKYQTSADPSAVKIIIEFSPAEASSSQEYARFKVYKNSGFASNRYFVETIKLDDLEKSGGFNWKSVGSIKIYVSVMDGTSYSDEYYVAIDGLRIENKTIENPLYGMTGYTVIKNTITDSQPIVKETNSSNLIEFRFAMDVI